MGWALSSKKTFRFEQLWLEHLEFDENIRAWREELSEGDEPSMYKFQHKLKGLKEKIKKWNKEEFGNIFSNKNIVEGCLQEVQSTGINEGYSTDLEMEELSLFSRIEGRETKEEILW